MTVLDSMREMEAKSRGIRRRRFLLVAATAIAGYFGYRWYRRQPMEFVQKRHGYLTPNRDFYRVSIGSYPKKPDLAEWTLVVEGPADRFQLSYRELEALPAEFFAQTLECVSNRVGGDDIGNAQWKGTRLAPLLERVMGRAGEGENRRVAFFAMDGFYSSVPLELALSPEVRIAYQMNGAPLPREHGFPARILLPGKYGMKQPRWLKRVAVTDDSIRGYWENRGWCERCDVKSTSRFDAAQQQPDGSWKIVGIAYCGAQPVGAVRVSLDGGATWADASLTSPAVENAWATWEFMIPSPAPRNAVLAVQAIDARGERQEASFSGAFPSGATGLHKVRFENREL